MPKKSLVSQLAEILTVEGFRPRVEGSYIHFKYDGSSFNVFVDEKDDYVHIRYGLNAKYDRLLLLQIANSLTGKYKYVKVYVDDEDDVIYAQADMSGVEANLLKSTFLRELETLFHVCSEIYNEIKEKSKRARHSFPELAHDPSNTNDLQDWKTRRTNYQMQVDSPDHWVNVVPDDRRNARLGYMLSKVYDVKEEELTDMYVYSDFSKIGDLICDSHEIAQFDLCKPFVRERDGKPSFLMEEVLMLTINWAPVNSSLLSDMSNKRQILLHLRPLGREKDMLFISASLCIPPTAYDEDPSGITDTKGLFTHTLNFVYGYHSKTDEQQMAEYRYFREEALDKIKAGQEPSEFEYFLTRDMSPIMGRDFYWGKKAIADKRFWDAIRYFEHVHRFMQDKWNQNSFGDDDHTIFAETCYCLGFCYHELRLYQKALFYMETPWLTCLTEYRMEYLNILVNSGDFRAANYLISEMERLSEMKRQDIDDEIVQYHKFLRRRLAYVYVNINQLDRAEQILRDMLDEDDCKGFAEKELEYIAQLRKMDKEQE